MKAVVYHGNRDIRIEDVPEPIPNAEEVKLRIDYCGICATDVEEYLYGPKFISHDVPNSITGKKLPLITGHEMTGTVIERGSNIKNIELGSRVAVNTVLTCDICAACRSGNKTLCQKMAVAGFDLNGGLADYMIWKGSEVIKLPDKVSSEQAVFAEPASVAMHAVRKSSIRDGQLLGILGCGTIGLLILQIAKSFGASVVAFDKSQSSLEMAKILGADHTINVSQKDYSEKISKFTSNHGLDVVIDSAGGKQTPNTAIDMVKPGGTVTLVAIYTHLAKIDFNDLVATEKKLIGSLAYRRDDLEDVLELIANNSVKTANLISQKICIDDVIDKGFSEMMKTDKDVFRVVVSPG